MTTHRYLGIVVLCCTQLQLSLHRSQGKMGIIAVVGRLLDRANSSSDNDAKAHTIGLRDPRRGR